MSRPVLSARARLHPAEPGIASLLEQSLFLRILLVARATVQS